jgi:hypothetical protein
MMDLLKSMKTETTHTLCRSGETNLLSVNHFLRRRYLLQNHMIFKKILTPFLTDYFFLRGSQGHPFPYTTNLTYLESSDPQGRDFRKVELATTFSRGQTAGTVYKPDRQY